MDKVTSIAKGGWHPEKTGSVRGDLKAIVGRGGDKDIKGARERALAHRTTPLSTLKDPSTFEPPPKRAVFDGGSNDPDATSSQVGPSSSISRPVPAKPQTPADTDDEDIQPSGPFKVDTTGLSTANLPKPPVRRLDSPSSGPANSTFPSRASTLPISGNTAVCEPLRIKKPGPPLPPRLPPREYVAVASSKTPTSPPPSYTQATTSALSSTTPRNVDQGAGLLNQAAISRLGAAGVSVPGLDIGSQGHKPDNSNYQQQQSSQQTAANVSELQSRFAALGNAVNTRAEEGHISTAPPVARKPILPPKPTLPSSFASASDASDAQGGTRKPPPVPFGTKPR